MLELEEVITSKSSCLKSIDCTDKNICSLLTLMLKNSSTICMFIDNIYLFEESTDKHVKDMLIELNSFIEREDTKLLIILNEYNQGDLNGLDTIIRRKFKLDPSVNLYTIRKDIVSAKHISRFFTNSKNIAYILQDKKNGLLSINSEESELVESCNESLSKLITLSFSIKTIKL